jgi:hypothetical protein
MKMTNIARYSLVYIFGVVTAIGLLSLYSFTRPAAPVNAPEAFTPVTVAEANALFLGYFKTATKPDSPVKGFFLDRNQLEALNQLGQETPDAPGFRVYLGREKEGSLVGILVAVDKNNIDLVVKGVFKTASAVTGPCPTVCDSQSPIIKD